MTAQIPDKIEIKCINLELGNLLPYAIVTGDINKNYGWGDKYKFKSKANPESDIHNNALHRGYISKYEINEAGELILLSYEYPFQNENKYEKVNEKIEGDFYLVLKESFFERRTYIPFVNGVIIKDKTKWRVEKV